MGALGSERERRRASGREGRGREEGGRALGRGGREQELQRGREAGREEGREGGRERDGGRERGELDSFRHHCLFLKKQFVERSFPVHTVD